MTKYTDISLDIETLGVGPRAIILSIGAVAFNRNGAEIEPDGVNYDTFSIHIDIDDQRSSREINNSTLMWWFDQPLAAKKIIEGQQDAVTLQKAMIELIDFIGWNTDSDTVRVWGNGAAFDNAIVSDAFRQCDLNTPWKFWNDRCLRTLLGEFQENTGVSLKEEIEFTGVRHSAVTDAIYQANLVIAATPKLFSTRKES